MTTHWLDWLSNSEDQALALIDAHEQVTYALLRSQVGMVAQQLYDEFGDGGFLLLRAESSVRFVVTLLGIMQSGNVPIPVASDLPAEDIDYICKKSCAKGVLAPLSTAEFDQRSSLDARRVDLPALIMFTSGTTGYPKGVIISHANLRHSCAAMADYLRYREYPSAAVVLPLHYSYALLSQVLCQLSIGGRVALFENFRNPIKFARRVTELELQTFCGVPSTYVALTTVHAMSKLAMPSVRVICSAGAAMHRGRFEQVKEIFPQATFYNNYGMTEAAPRIAYIREDDPRFEQPTCGRPMPGVEVRVVDRDTYQSLPNGEYGVLVVRGPNITSGYLNDAELTEKAFTPDGYLISGDIAHLDEGYIYVHGRADDIFNVAGEKVSPLEVERPLNQIVGVESAAVVGIPDPQRGMVPVAFLKLSRPLDRRALLEALRGHLPSIKVPQRYFEVRRFPLTANGKLRRQDLSVDNSEFVVREIV
ncbi:MAG: acyl--CoA ligase [Planctomycetales bacterium]|nr:acyl--CoA ligase [Planctomycetales bacterium]